MPGSLLLALAVTGETGAHAHSLTVSLFSCKPLHSSLRAQLSQLQTLALAVPPQAAGQRWQAPDPRWLPELPATALGSAQL